MTREESITLRDLGVGVVRGRVPGNETECIDLVRGGVSET